MEKGFEDIRCNYVVIVYVNVSKEDFKNVDLPNEKFWQYVPSKKEFAIEK